MYRLNDARTEPKVFYLAAGIGAETPGGDVELINTTPGSPEVVRIRGPRGTYVSITRRDIYNGINWIRDRFRR